MRAPSRAAGGSDSATVIAAAIIEIVAGRFATGAWSAHNPTGRVGCGRVLLAVRRRSRTAPRYPFSSATSPPTVTRTTTRLSRRLVVGSIH